MTIREITTEYGSKLDYLDLEILLAHSLDKTREFVLTHPEYELTEFQIKNFRLKIFRRMRGEPIAHILGHKEFYGLDFVVNKHTLVPRPETELMVDLTLDLLRGKPGNTLVLDVGTGSGCIIISTAHKLIESNDKIRFFAADISGEALKIARKNAHIHNLNKEIKFIKSDLLSNISKVTLEQCNNLIVVANLPYLSKEIYLNAPRDVKKYEPKSALYSPRAGLAHYEKLLKQIKKILAANRELSVSCLFEISPEQKRPLTELAKAIFPAAEPIFHKDLAGKWRVCRISLPH